MAVKLMSDYIKQKTGGKDSIKVYTGNQLGGEKDTIEQVKIGVLDLVRINVAPMNNICPETMVPTMPFLFDSIRSTCARRSTAHRRADPERVRKRRPGRPRLLRERSPSI